MRRKKKERERKRDGQTLKFIHSFLGKSCKKEERRIDGKERESFAGVECLGFTEIRGNSIKRHPGRFSAGVILWTIRSNWLT